MKKLSLSWLLLGLVSFICLPWHLTEDGIMDLAWVYDGIPSTGLFQVLTGHWWLLPSFLAILVAIILQFTVQNPALRAKWTLICASFGILLMALQGLLVVRAGPRAFETFLMVRFQIPCISLQMSENVEA